MKYQNIKYLFLVVFFFLFSDLRANEKFENFLLSLHEDEDSIQKAFSELDFDIQCNFKEIFEREWGRETEVVLHDKWKDKVKNKGNARVSLDALLFLESKGIITEKLFPMERACLADLDKDKQFYSLLAALSDNDEEKMARALDEDLKENFIKKWTEKREDGILSFFAFTQISPKGFRFLRDVGVDIVELSPNKQPVYDLLCYGDKSKVIAEQVNVFITPTVMDEIDLKYGGIKASELATLRNYKKSMDGFIMILKMREITL